MGRTGPDRGKCNTCGREFPEREFRHRKVKGKSPWIEWQCDNCRRAYDTQQKRARRQGPGHQHYNEYMREYMRAHPQWNKPKTTEAPAINGVPAGVDLSQGIAITDDMEIAIPVAAEDVVLVLEGVRRKKP